MSSLKDIQELVNDTLDITGGVDVPRVPADPAADKIVYYWYGIVTAALHGSNHRLRAVSLLLENGPAYTAIALTIARSSFESAADLVYINKDVKSRLPKFLRHGLMATNEEENVEFQAKIDSLGVKAFPSTRWMQIRQVCNAIGWDLQNDTFYRYSSDSAHSGTSHLISDYLKLIGESKSPDLVTPTLCTTLHYHLVVADIAASLFDGSIDKEALESAIESCKSHMQDLTRMQHPDSA